MSGSRPEPEEVTVSAGTSSGLTWFVMELPGVGRASAAAVKHSTRAGVIRM